MKFRSYDDIATRCSSVSTHHRNLPPSEFSVEDLAKHRSCWKHVAGCLHKTQRKVAKRDVDNIRDRFEQTSYCFSDTYPHRRRSNLPIEPIESHYEVAKLDVDKIGAQFQQTASCLSYPHRRRSNLCTDTVESSFTRKKLDSHTFERLLENLWRSISEERKASFTHLDSMWFGLYLKADSKEKVLSWIKRRHIFSKKYVFVPIVCWGHWRLLILCHFGEDLDSRNCKPCMILLDSLHMADPRRLEPDIRKFVWDIYRTEGIMWTKDVISKIPLLVPKVPQQKNTECGSFVLYFLYLFLEAAPENFSISDGYPYFMNQDWFTRESFEQFCKNLDGQPLIQDDETSIPRLLFEQSWDADGIIILDD